MPFFQFLVIFFGRIFNIWWLELFFGGSHYLALIIWVEIMMFCLLQLIDMYKTEAEEIDLGPKTGFYA